MRKIRSFVLTFLLSSPILLTAQSRHTVSGTVRDKKSGETLIGASITLLEVPHSSALSNAYGFYSINAVAGNYKMVVSFTGYDNDTLTVSLNKDVAIQVGLSTGGVSLQEVVV